MKNLNQNPMIIYESESESRGSTSKLIFVIVDIAPGTIPAEIYVSLEVKI